MYLLKYTKKKNRAYRVCRAHAWISSMDNILCNIFLDMCRHFAVVWFEWQRLVSFLPLHCAHCDI